MELMMSKYDMRYKIQELKNKLDEKKNEIFELEVLLECYKKVYEEKFYNEEEYEYCEEDMPF